MKNPLMQEAFCLRGSVHEIQAKVRILKNRLPFMDDEEYERACESVERMCGELTKYSKRIDEIYLELDDDVPDIYAMEDEEDWASGGEEGSDS